MSCSFAVAVTFGKMFSRKSRVLRIKGTFLIYSPQSFATKRLNAVLVNSLTCSFSMMPTTLLFISMGTASRSGCAANKSTRVSRGFWSLTGSIALLLSQLVFH